jgi:hypothetical protein
MELMCNYILLDAARLGEQIHAAMELNPNHASLYKGRIEENLSDLGPYLFSIPQKENFINWYAANGWGNAWGVLMESEASFEEIYKHFSKFLIVKTEAGEELYFRFYDPRVLKIFLPTCDKDQIIEFFGPVEKFIVENDSKDEAVEFSHADGVLKQRIINAEDVFGKQVNDVAKETAAAPKKKKWIIIEDEPGKKLR